MILCANPLAQYSSHSEEIDAAVKAVMQKGIYILGQETRAFEAEFARYTGVEHGIGVGSGTEALHLALAALGIGKGDEVITVSHTAVATITAIELAGATPVLVDIDPATFNINADAIEDAITPATRAIIPVHLYGQPCAIGKVMDVAKKHGLRVVEDCAQAHGAEFQGRRVGSWGDVACFSFYPTKNLGALGDGGIVVTADASIAERARLLRQYGWAERYVSSVAGWNSRLDEIQSAILRVKLKYLDSDNALRRAIADTYTREIDATDVATPVITQDVTHAFHLYVVRTPFRDELQAFLDKRGIGALIHYPVPVHLQPAYVGSIRHTGLKHTEQAATEILSLPMYPELASDSVQAVIAAVNEFNPAREPCPSMV